MHRSTTILLVMILLSISISRASVYPVLKDSVNKKILVYELFNQIYERSVKKDTVIVKRDTLKGEPFRVFGWYLEDESSTDIPYDFNVLTDIIFADSEIKITDQSIRIEAPPWEKKQARDLVKLAQEQKTNTYLSLKASSFSVIQRLVTNSNYQKTLQNYIKRIIRDEPSLDGICLDFSSVSIDYVPNLMNFISEVSKELKDKSLILSLPIDPKNAEYDFYLLNDDVDEYIVKAFNYHMLNPGPSPVAPLNDGAYNVSNTVRRYQELGIAPKNLIVSLPYFGVSWGGLPSNLKFQSKINYHKMMELLKNEEAILYSSDSSSASYRTGLKQYEYRYHFDNKQTLEKKFKWVEQQGLGGIGIWALGFDQGRTELWNLLSENYAREEKAEEDSTQVLQAKLDSAKSNNTIDPKVLEQQAKERYDKIVADTKSILRQKEVLFTIGTLLPVFLTIAFIITILQSGILEKILIREIPIFFKSLVFLVVFILVCIGVASFVLVNNPETAAMLQTGEKETMLVSSSIINQLIKFGLIGLGILLLISTKALLKFNRDLP